MMLVKRLNQLAAIRLRVFQLCTRATAFVSHLLVARNTTCGN